MSFAAYLAEDRRLVLLRLLAEMPAYGANSSVLHSGLDRLGHKVPRDTIKADLAWLAEQGLVALEEVGPVVVATLAERGQDVAAGRAVVPGVKRSRTGSTAASACARASPGAPRARPPGSRGSTPTMATPRPRSSTWCRRRARACGSPGP